MEADRDLMNLYRYNKETRVEPLGSCDDRCAKGELCDLRYTDYEREQACHDLPVNSTTAIFDEL